MFKKLKFIFSFFCIGLVFLLGLPSLNSLRQLSVNNAEKDNNKISTNTLKPRSLEFIEEILAKKLTYVTGSEDIKKLREYIISKMKSFGFVTTEAKQTFTYYLRSDVSEDNPKKGTNLVFSIPGRKSLSTNNKTIVLGAHYDLVKNHLNNPKPEQIFNDNASGIATLLALAEYFVKNPPSSPLKFLFWDAEEVNLKGSKAYAKTNRKIIKENWELYINLDSVAGGDELYVGHGLDDGTEGNNNDKKFYEKILQIAKNVGVNIKPSYAYSKEKEKIGELYPASDHVPFNKVGIPVIGFEATNYKIEGEWGQDGYSQVAHKRFWFPEAGSATKEETKIGIVGGFFDEKGVNEGGYSRDKEEGWGKLWHTDNDNLELINSLFPGRVEKQLNAVFTVLRESIELEDTKKILAFQKNWNAEKVSNYLLWLPVFDVQEVKLSQNQVFPVNVLATAIKDMLTAEKFDFTKLKGKARIQLLNLLNAEEKLKEEKTFQDDVWKQIKNHQKWKTIEGYPGWYFLQSIRNLLLEIQDLEIKKIVYPFFPEGYDLSFLQENPDWKTIAFKNLLEGMTVKINGTNVEFYSHLFSNKVVFQVSMKELSTIFSEITIANIITTLRKTTNVQNKLNAEKILTFQKNWDAEKVSNYLLWLPVFDIEEVKLSQNRVFPVAALTTAIKDMLLEEKFDFTKLKGKARRELLNILNAQGKLKEEKTFQDDVWKQIQNHSKWKAVEGIEGEVSLLFIRTLLFKIQELGISQVSHPFFPESYDLNFLQDNPDWKTISFKELLEGMTVKINGTNVEFYSHFFPNKIVFQVPMKKLDTVFSGITITNIIKVLEKAISDHSQQEKKLESKNKGLIIGLSIAGGVVFLSFLGGLYWFFKIKK